MQAKKTPKRFWIARIKETSGTYIDDFYTVSTSPKGKSLIETCVKDFRRVTGIELPAGEGAFFVLKRVK